MIRDFFDWIIWKLFVSKEERRHQEEFFAAIDDYLERSRKQIIETINKLP